MLRHRLGATLFAFALGSVVTAGPSFAGPENVHEGQWEITTQMTIPGMPFVPPPVTHTQCVTRKDAAPRPPKDHGDCEVSTIKGEGGKVSWHVKCTGQRPAEGDGEIQYTGDSMEGHATLKMKNPRTGQPMEAQQSIKGRRLGDCAPAPPRPIPPT